MTPTDQRLREIAERENKATNGPWEQEPHDPRIAMHFCDKDYPGDPANLVMETHEGYFAFCREPDAAFVTHSRQDVPWLLALIQKQREALEHIVKCGEFQCNQMCAKDYIPRRKHAPDCPIEYLESARDALNFSPENL